MTNWRPLSSAALFVALPCALLFCAIETQAAEKNRVYETCVNWFRFHRLETFPDQMPMTVARTGTCSPERLRAACRLAVTRAPVQALKLCPDELCPSVGRALIGLGLSTIPRSEVATVYRLCPQQW